MSEIKVEQLPAKVFYYSLLQNLLWLIPLYVLSAVVGAFIGSLTFAVLGFAIFLIGPLFAVFWIAKSKVGKVNSVMSKSHQLIFEHLKNVDYFTYGGGGGVGVDVKNQMFCLVKAKTANDISFKLITFADIKEWQSFRPGKSDWVGVGMAASTSAQMQNQIETRKQAFNTGLTIITKQLDDHKTFIHMPIKSAEAWVQLLSKAINTNDLGTSSPPRFFPSMEV